MLPPWYLQPYRQDLSPLPPMVKPPVMPAPTPLPPTRGFPYGAPSMPPNPRSGKVALPPWAVANYRLAADASIDPVGGPFVARPQFPMMPPVPPVAQRY